MLVYHCKWMSLLYKLNTFELWEMWPCSDPTQTTTTKNMETMNVKYAHELIYNNTHQDLSALFWFCGYFFIIVDCQFSVDCYKTEPRAQISW